MEKTFTYGGTKYTLTYTLDSIRRMESNGFVFEDIQSKPATTIPLLFSGALIEKHRNLDADKIEEIYKALPKKDALVSALIKMYGKAISQITEEPDGKGKNAVTEVDW